MTEGLKDKVVTVTGGAHGIGKAYCLAFGNTHSEENSTEEMIKFRESSVTLRALKRIQRPSDAVGAMLFLASPLSDFMTGQTVNVDGGISFL